MKDIIDRQDAIEKFNLMMEDNSPIRALFLTGSSKMGKSLLMQNYFKELACTIYDAECFYFNLSNPIQSIFEILETMRSWSTCSFSKYQSAYSQWFNPSVNISSTSILSYISVKGSINFSLDDEMIIRQLTNQFCVDFKSHSKTVVILFDAFDDAAPHMQHWLTKVFLMDALSAHNIKIILAGRILPEPDLTYKHHCVSHTLKPVDDINDFIEYCKRLEIQLEDHDIMVLAKTFQFCPGLFVEYVLPVFGK